MKTSNIAIVTDSTADLPDHLTSALNIHVVPNLIIINGKSLVDGKDISRQDYYKRLPEMDPLPTTATASSGAYKQIYERLLQSGFNQVLSIHASKLLSGIFNAASVAAQSFGERIHVLDSEQASLGLGFQVLGAAEAALRGTSLDNILELAGDIRRRIRLVALLDTLEYIRRSGRVSWARARIGQILKIKPLVELKSGKVLSMGEARTFHKGLIRLLDILRSLGPLEQLGILHTNAEVAAHQLLNGLAPELPAEPLLINVTTVIGTHVGPGGLGFVAVVK